MKDNIKLESLLSSSTKQAESFKDRLKTLIGDESVRSFSRRCNVSETVVRAYLAGSSEPGLGVLIKIANLSAVNIQWLATGIGQMRTGDSVQEPSAVHQAGSVHPDEYAYIPLYNVEASAGHGSYVETEEVASRLAFRRDWINKEIHANPSNLHLIYVRGDSMQPALESGQVVMVDTSAAHDAIRDGIHVIQIDGSVLIKRLQRLPGNKIMVMSDNKIYPSFEADLKSGDIKIIGRVIWHAGRI